MAAGGAQAWLNIKRIGATCQLTLYGDLDSNFPTQPTTMLSKSRLRRLLPGRRRNRRDDPIIQAIPISEEPPIFHDHDGGSVQEMPLMYSTQQQCVSSLRSSFLGSSKPPTFRVLYQPTLRVSVFRFQSKTTFAGLITTANQI